MKLLYPSPKEPKTCKFCGIKFTPKHSTVFCSIKCLLKERRRREDLKNFQRKQLKISRLSILKKHDASNINPRR